MAMHVHTLRRMVPGYYSWLEDPTNPLNRVTHRRHVDPEKQDFVKGFAGKRSLTPAFIQARPLTSWHRGSECDSGLRFSCAYRPSIRVSIRCKISESSRLKRGSSCLRRRVENAPAAKCNISQAGMVPIRFESLSARLHVQLKTQSDIPSTIPHHRIRKEHPILSTRMREGCNMTQLLAHV